jgi:uncharacterized protein (DUF1015 family)
MGVWPHLLTQALNEVRRFNIGLLKTLINLALPLCAKWVALRLVLNARRACHPAESPPPVAMAHIRPFRALRYDPDKIGALENIALPLVDQVSAEQLRHYYRVYESAIHVAWPRSTAHATDRVMQWRKHGVLVQDPLPAIYPYYQRFTLYGARESFLRKGFICLVKLNDKPADPDILVHEDIIPSALASRVDLMEQTLLNLAPAHGLYTDPDHTLERIMDPYMQAPLTQMVDFTGVENTLGMIQNRQALQQFAALLKDKKIVLADGHHRLAAAQELHRRKPDQQTARYLLMYLSNAAAGDNRILAFHRLVNLNKHILGRTFDRVAFLDKLRPFFHIKPFTDRSPVYEQVEGHKRTFALIFKDAQYVLALRPEVDAERDTLLPLPPSVKRLDYTLLHYFILDRALGLPYTEQQNSPALSYWKDFSKARDGALHKDNHMAIIVNAVSMDELLAVTHDHARMPQKSTYFFPKVLCGLLYASVNDADNASAFDTSF